MKTFETVEQAAAWTATEVQRHQRNMAVAESRWREAERVENAVEYAIAQQVERGRVEVMSDVFERLSGQLPTPENLDAWAAKTHTSVAQG